MGENKIPDGWVSTKLSEISSKLVDGSHTPPPKQESGRPMLSAVNIFKNKIHFSTYRLISEDSFIKEDQRTDIKSGDVLLTIVGAIGRAAVVPEKCEKFTLQRSVAVIKPILLDSRFLMYQLEESRISNFFKNNARGTAQKGIYLRTLGSTEIWLPSLNEQRRIVAKIEALFAELEAGVASLKTAQAQLKTYRQALLKHAFAGKLTEAWRTAHADELEDATTLLRRIQAERQARYEAETAVWEGNGRVGKKPRPPQELPPLTPAELNGLPELPAGWAWVKLGEAFGIYVGATPSRKIQDYWGGDIHWVSSGEVAFCRIRQTKETITEFGYANSSTDIHPIGTVMLGMIGEGKTRGQAAILDIEATHNQNTAAIRVSETDCSPECLFHYLFMQYEMTRRIGSGNNQKALNKERVSEMRFPLSPIAEQRKIIEIIDEKLSEVDQLEQTIIAALQQAEALRLSILKKAFSGQLVPQDPTDEPASVLLARIQAAKETANI